jgi:hypothetical protein
VRGSAQDGGLEPLRSLPIPPSLLASHRPSTELQGLRHRAAAHMPLVRPLWKTFMPPHAELARESARELPSAHAPRSSPHKLIRLSLVVRPSLRSDLREHFLAAGNSECRRMVLPKNQSKRPRELTYTLMSPCMVRLIQLAFSLPSMHLHAPPCARVQSSMLAPPTTRSLGSPRAAALSSSPLLSKPLRRSGCSTAPRYSDADAWLGQPSSPAACPRLLLSHAHCAPPPPIPLRSGTAGPSM